MKMDIGTDMSMMIMEMNYTMRTQRNVGINKNLIRIIFGYITRIIMEIL